MTFACEKFEMQIQLKSPRPRADHFNFPSNDLRDSRVLENGGKFEFFSHQFQNVRARKQELGKIFVWLVEVARSALKDSFDTHSYTEC